MGSGLNAHVLYILIRKIIKETVFKKINIALLKTAMGVRTFFG